MLAALFVISLLSLTVSCRKVTVESVPTSSGKNAQTFLATGVIKELRPADKSIVINHDAITNYMAAMTMTFSVRNPKQLSSLSVGDQIAFELHVTDDESWIAKITKTGRVEAIAETPAAAPTNAVVCLTNTHPLLDYKFTNEFGQPVSFNDFKGRTVAFTFFFTRCPLPEYCPRLMKNFLQASEKLRSLPDAPTNWHFLAISFDTTFDTPAVLRNYAQRYQYDSNHWSFLTGAPDKIAELATASGVTYTPDGASFNHNFRTLVLDAAGQLQISFPIGGDLSEMLVTEILKAARVSNH